MIGRLSRVDFLIGNKAFVMQKLFVTFTLAEVNLDLPKCIFALTSFVQNLFQVKRRIFTGKPFLLLYFRSHNFCV